MFKLRIFLGVLLPCLMFCVGSSTQTNAQATNPIDQSILEASAISVEFPLPLERPTLTWLLRHKMKFNEEDLVKRFLKGEITKQRIVSSVYGDGTGYLSKKKGDVEAHLKIFKYGFEYQVAAKNINKGVAKFIPVSGEAESGATMFDQGYTGFEYVGNVRGKWLSVYTTEEGKSVAQKYLNDLVGTIGNQGNDFTVKNEAVMEKIEDGLFLLNVNKYFRGVQLLDDYIQISLDADKKVVGVSYFWDDSLVPGPPPPGDKLIVDAGYAVNQAKKWVIQQSDGYPPHLTLMKMRLGYITMRGDYVTVIPVWLLACSWQHKVGADMDVMSPGLRRDKPTMKRFVEWLETYDTYIAIEAISGLPTEL